MAVLPFVLKVLAIVACFNVHGIARATSDVIDTSSFELLLKEDILTHTESSPNSSLNIRPLKDGVQETYTQESTSNDNDTLIGNDPTSDDREDVVDDDDSAHMVHHIDGVVVYNTRVYDGMICDYERNESSGVIKLPDQNLDKNCTAWSWKVGVGEGYNADVTLKSLTVDQTAGEFMLIGPGTSIADLWEDESIPLITSIIKTPRKFRILRDPHFTIFLLTNTPTGFTGGFELSFEQAGLLATTPEPTTPAPTLPSPAENITAEIIVYLLGKAPQEFVNQSLRTGFQKVVSEMAIDYCKVKEIALNLTAHSSENVVLSLVRQCNLVWPQSDHCVQVNMSVPLILTDSHDPENFELTAEHLQEMWDMYAYNSSALKDIGLSVYEPPKPETYMHLWLGVSIGVLIVFILVLIAVWRIEIFRDYSRMKGSQDMSSYSQRSSMASIDSWAGFSEHQLVPPFMEYAEGGMGYVEYEPEFNGPVPIQSFQQIPAEVKTPTFAPLPRYGPPVGFGGALQFYGNTLHNSFTNPAFEEEDEDEDDMKMEEEINTGGGLKFSDNLKNMNNNSFC